MPMRAEPCMVRHVVEIEAPFSCRATHHHRWRWSPVEEGKVETVRRVCRLMFGLTSDEVLQAQAIAPVTRPACLPEMTESAEPSFA